MSSSPLNEATAKLVERLTDRILPDDNLPADDDRDWKSRDFWKNIGSTALGTFVWAEFAVRHFVARGSGGRVGDDLFGFEVAWSLRLTAIAGCMMLTILIIASFERRRPLTFFFYGLLFPTLASVIVAYGVTSWFDESATT